MTLRPLFTATAVFLAVLPLATAAQEPSTGVVLGGTYSVQGDIVYHTAGGQEMTLDLYTPSNVEGPVPVLVYYHGGGWVIGDRTGASLLLLPYLEQGFAVANVSYRLEDDALAPAAVVDALCALRFIGRMGAQAGIDPTRIVTSGHSAGGHLSMIVAMLPQDSGYARECTTVPELFDNEMADVRPAAVVNWYGITDVNDLLDGPHRQMYAVQWIGGLHNGDEVARSVSPLTYVREGLPAVITIHGDADNVVPHEHGTRMKAALDEVGVPNELITVPGGGHGGFSVEQDVGHYAAIWAFLEKHGVIP
ncbi:MAG: alpha/beta hydrolase [Gemmatimonadota bacterium]|nr:alpha/beta hydrolase [Gemmatimonadota bacterium]